MDIKLIAKLPMLKTQAKSYYQLCHQPHEGLQHHRVHPHQLGNQLQTMLLFHQLFLLWPHQLLSQSLFQSLFPLSPQLPWFPQLLPLLQLSPLFQLLLSLSLARAGIAAINNNASTARTKKMRLIDTTSLTWRSPVDRLCKGFCTTPPTQHPPKEGHSPTNSMFCGCYEYWHK